MKTKDLSCRQALWLAEVKGPQLRAEVKTGSCVDTSTCHGGLDDFQESKKMCGLTFTLK